MDLLTRPQTFVGTFTMAHDDDATAEFALHMGGALAGDGPVPFNVCIDDVYLDDPQFVRKEEPTAAPIPNVLVNQVGYLPHLPKLAIVKSASTTPENYQLVSSGGDVVASGTTLPVGLDAASGDTVHVADFSSFEGTGRGFTLKVAGNVEPPVRHRARHLQEAEVRRARVLLSEPQRHRDRDALRGRQAVDAARRATSARASIRATTTSRASPIPAATIRWTSPAAGTTPATTANTWSTPASASGRC